MLNRTNWFPRLKTDVEMGRISRREQELMDVVKSLHANLHFVTSSYEEGSPTRRMFEREDAKVRKVLGKRK